MSMVKYNRCFFEFTGGTTYDSPTSKCKRRIYKWNIDLDFSSGEDYFTLGHNTLGNTGTASLNEGISQNNGTKLAFGHGEMKNTTDHSVAIYNFNKIEVTGGKSIVNISATLITSKGLGKQRVQFLGKILIDVGTSNLKGLCYWT